MDTEQQDHIRHPATHPGPQAGGNTASLLPGQREVLRQALADAVCYRDVPLHCSDCEALTSLCGHCADELSQARAYLTLSRELDISLPGPHFSPDDLAKVTTHCH